MALLWSHNPWVGREPWQQALRTVVEGWQIRRGGDERVPSGWAQERAKRPDLAVLQDHGLLHVAGIPFPFSTALPWNISSALPTLCRFSPRRSSAMRCRRSSTMLPRPCCLSLTGVWSPHRSDFRTNSSSKGAGRINGLRSPQSDDN